MTPTPKKEGLMSADRNGDNVDRIERITERITRLWDGLQIQEQAELMRRMPQMNAAELDEWLAARDAADGSTPDGTRAKATQRPG